MAAGYALGPVFTQGRAARVQQLFMLGAAVTLGFVVLRATNLYGDPAPWAIQDNLLATVLSFINCEKYPPSLLYLGMTLGPALMLVAAFEWVRGPVADWIAIFGRVPFFYYVVHIFLLHALAIVFAWATLGDIGWLFGPLAGRKPAAYGLPLAGIYAVWRWSSRSIRSAAGSRESNAAGPSGGGVTSESILISTPARFTLFDRRDHSNEHKLHLTVIPQAFGAWQLCCAGMTTQIDIGHFV